MRIVLVQPEIPQNTGNIGRLAAATGAELILVGKLGFSLDEKAIRRSGLDYWKAAEWNGWKKLLVTQISLDEFYELLQKESSNCAFISTKGGSNYYTDIPAGVDILIFGNESSGLPKEIYSSYPQQLYRIPMLDGARSINLATAVGIVLYNQLAKAGFPKLI